MVSIKLLSRRGITMNIYADGNNFFNTGWLACYLGLERTHPYEASLKSIDVEGFHDGWDMCKETIDMGGGADLMSAFHNMRRLGQVLICWVDDDNNDIE
jgi:hypothetical protein